MLSKIAGPFVSNIVNIEAMFFEALEISVRANVNVCVATGIKLVICLSSVVSWSNCPVETSARLPDELGLACSPNVVTPRPCATSAVDPCGLSASPSSAASTMPSTTCPTLLPSTSLVSLPASSPMALLAVEDTCRPVVCSTARTAFCTACSTTGTVRLIRGSTLLMTISRISSSPESTTPMTVSSIFWIPAGVLYFSIMVIKL
mmetsp:Transcript_50666/g.141873  ORF Transcript_50666/g.141873 Transcript_50666/m.141873 type:complete len:204 (-) Transcript_50666:59-670(-)